MTPKIILIIDDHALFRAGIAAMLSTALDDVVVVGCATMDEAMTAVAGDPAVVLLDIQLPGRSGLDGMALIHHRWPAVRIVIVSAHDQSDTVDAALRRGAAAFLSKIDRPERMLAVLREMLAAPPPRPSPNGAGWDAGGPLLTARQLEVLDLTGRGLSNKMIGQRLGLSEHTVRGHVHALLAALAVARRTEAVFKARQLGLIR